MENRHLNHGGCDIIGIRGITMDPQIVQRMIMAIAVLLLLDAVMTWYVVSKPGYSEANFIVKRLIEKIGMVPAMVAKTIIGFGLLGVL